MPLRMKAMMKVTPRAALSAMNSHAPVTAPQVTRNNPSRSEV